MRSLCRSRQPLHQWLSRCGQQSLPDLSREFDLQVPVEHVEIIERILMQHTSSQMPAT